MTLILLVFLGGVLTILSPCILPVLPYVAGWYAKYKDHGLVVIGVHAPEPAGKAS